MTDKEKIVSFLFGAVISLILFTAIATPINMAVNNKANGHNSCS